MEQEILVLGFSGYDFEQDGSRMVGAKIHYISKGLLNLDLKKGLLPMKSTMPLDLVKSLNNGNYPFVATAVMISIPDSKGNPVLTIGSLKDLKTVKVDNFFKIN